MKVAIFTAIAVLCGLGLWFAPRFLNKVRFEGFPGVYICEEFGLPDKDHSTIRVDENLNVFGVKDSTEMMVGTLRPIGESRTRSKRELSNAAIEASGSSLDPAAEHVAEGIGNSLVFSATRDAKLLYSQACFRK